MRNFKPCRFSILEQIVDRLQCLHIRGASILRGHHAAHAGAACHQACIGEHAQRIAGCEPTDAKQVAQLVLGGQQLPHLIHPVGDVLAQLVEHRQIARLTRRVVVDFGGGFFSLGGLWGDHE